MKNFNDKWQVCVARAREQATPPAEVPFGFVERVWHRRAPAEAEQLNGEGLWMRFGLRTLAGACALLLVLAVVHWRVSADTPQLRPPLEHSIVEFSGIL